MDAGPSFRVYWLFGAVLNVPFLAGGELQLLFEEPDASICVSTSSWCS